MDYNGRFRKALALPTTKCPSREENVDTNGPAFICRLGATFQQHTDCLRPTLRTTLISPTPDNLEAKQAPAMSATIEAVLH